MNKTAFKTDIKMILRDPILVILMLAPILAILIIKLLLNYLTPWLFGEFGFELRPYYGYVLGGCFLLSPMMLGTVAGFLMIDEKDGKIFDLIAITPAGYSGYMLNRLALPFAMSIIYTFLIYTGLNIYVVNVWTLMMIGFFVSIESILVGTMLFLFAEDKVQGLTYSKGLGVFVILSMADLLNRPRLSIIAGAIPFYWIFRLIHNQENVIIFLAGLAIHGLWVIMAIKKY